jgi:hypothetical protein
MEAMRHHGRHGGHGQNLHERREDEKREDDGDRQRQEQKGRLEILLIHEYDCIMNSTILITGATGGIGHDAAITLAKRGHKVFACAHLENQIASARQSTEREGLDITWLRLDVTDPADIAKAKEIAPDVLINNAAVVQAVRRALYLPDLRKWQRELGIEIPEYKPKARPLASVGEIAEANHHANGGDKKD